METNQTICTCGNSKFTKKDFCTFVIMECSKCKEKYNDEQWEKLEKSRIKCECGCDSFYSIYEICYNAKFNIEKNRMEVDQMEIANVDDENIAMECISCGKRYELKEFGDIYNIEDNIERWY